MYFRHEIYMLVAAGWDRKATELDEMAGAAARISPN